MLGWRAVDSCEREGLWRAGLEGSGALWCRLSSAVCESGTKTLSIFHNYLNIFKTTFIIATANLHILVSCFIFIKNQYSGSDFGRLRSQFWNYLEKKKSSWFGKKLGLWLHSIDPGLNQEDDMVTQNTLCICERKQ